MRNDPQLPPEAKPIEPKEPLEPIDWFDKIYCSMSDQEFDKWILQLEDQSKDEPLHRPDRAPLHRCGHISSLSRVGLVRRTAPMGSIGLVTGR